MLQDLRFAFRLIARDLWFSTVVVVALALGIGLNALVFTLPLTAVAVETFNERFNGGKTGAVFLAMAGAVAFVLLIACANVVNLLLSRSFRRAREMGVRIAMGATRWRIVRHLLVESILLGAIAGVLGLGLTAAGVKIFDAPVTGLNEPYWISSTIDYVVFGYLAAICVFTGILFGLAPALQLAKININDVVKEAGRGVVAMVACVIPARRAMHIDPVIALRGPNRCGQV